MKHKLIINKDLISRYEFYKNTSLILNDTISTLLILSSMDKNFDDSSYLQTIEVIEKELDTLLNSMTFSVTGSAKSKLFIDVISTGLTDKKIHLSSLNRLDENHLNIDVSLSDNTMKSYGFDIVRITLAIKVKSKQNKVVGGNQLVLTGQATQGVKFAINNAAKKLKKQIEADGVMKVIGINISNI